MNQTTRGVLYVSVWVMLWGTAASLADFVLLERGAYDAETKSTGKLVEALAEAPRRGWLVADMKRDWNTIFQPE